ncbi:hypothetical protein ACEPAI_4161 [Sanghuangporus weigelae]
MPHRPADSRLLSNLLNHERDYVRSLYTQLEVGQASLASFSAYAAASPPPASRTIGSVATALFGAQDALKGYVLAVEEWCEQLKMLKDMEDEVGNIARDREILVDRLIKASKTNNPKRRSLLSSSGSNQGSPVFSGSHQSLDQLGFSNSKLNLAQTELQACETHLTEKERILAQMRESCITGGLKMRCRALAECGSKWSEVGKIGLQALESTNSRSSLDDRTDNVRSLDRTNSTQKPLPDINYPYQRPSSDVSSSLAPSQSASQIFHPNAVSSEQYHPSTSSSSGPTARAPEADIHDGSHLRLNLPPAHAISEEDHYTPPQARLQQQTILEDEPGGSSCEEESDERQYEVHENPLFVHPNASKANNKQIGSKTHLPLKRPKRANSASATNLPVSTSAPLPSLQSSPTRSRQQSSDPFGTSSSGRAYSDGHPDSPRTRKRSMFGLHALSGLFHKRDHTATLPSEDASGEGAYSSSLPKKGKWRTRIDKNLKRTGRGDQSSDDETGPVPQSQVETRPVPSYLLPAAEARAHLAESRSTLLEKDANAPARPKRAPSSGKKLRKASDGSQRKVSGAESTQSAPPSQVNQAKKSDVTNTAGKTGVPASQSLVNGLTSSPMSSASVSRSSTVKSGSSARSASLDMPSASARPKRMSAPLDGAQKGAAATGKHRRRTSLGHVSSPPTHGQMSLLSIVEDVTRQNRQAWLSTNPNNLLIEVKAPKSVYDTLNLDNPASEVASQEKARSDVGNNGAVRRRESSLRPQLMDEWRNSLPASNSEPYLPLKRLPPTPLPAPKAPLRSALRNRSASPNPASLTSPRNGSPVPNPSPLQSGNSSLTPPRPSAARNDSGESTVKDDDAASTTSAYETGHEDFDSGPPTPTGQPKSLPQLNGYDRQQQQQQSLPNGHVAESKSDGSHLSGSDTVGTATPPSRRKSVRVSLRPTFSPTPPAVTDYEEDRSPWAPEPPQKSESRWVSRRSTENAAGTGPGAGVWQNSSDEDEEYTRAREMLSTASKKLNKHLKQ